MTEGQAALKRAMVNAMAGLCTCGRKLNKQGKVCCRMCRENYGSHSILCQKVNSR